MAIIDWAGSAVTVVMASALIGAPVPALAHGPAQHGSTAPAVAPPQQMAWGVAGEASSVGRVVEVSMGDTMRFTPSRLEFRLGETVRFVVRNTGRSLHEFVLGTRVENERHAELMKRFPNMAHDEPYMAHVEAGGKGEIIWTFNRAGEFEFACLIAGHYDAGMFGRIRVVAAKGPST